MKNKNKIINSCLLLFSIITFAQVKIGDNPTAPIGTSSALELESTNLALQITRVANTAAISTPVNGMLIYDISSSCVKGYENGAWTACAGYKVLALCTLTCGSATFSPATITTGTAYTGTITVPYTGGNGAAYPAGTAIASTGITGLSATLVAGTLANGAGNLTYNVTGTPAGTVAGNATFAFSLGGQSCNVVAGVVNISNPIGTGKFSGKACFDIAFSNDNIGDAGALSGRTSSKDDFNLATSNTQVYTFTPSGTVSNVRFVYVNTNGTVITALTGGNSGNSITTAQTATATYSSTLNTTAQGLFTSNGLTADIYVIYNNNATNTGTDMQIKLTVSVKDAACCGAFIAAGVWKPFMCHNLGADTSLNPNVPVQGIYGNYYQWGRSTIVADSNSPLTSAAISGWNTTIAAAGSWSDTIKTINDPCPSGYQIPTRAQMSGLFLYNTIGYVGGWVSQGFTSTTTFGPSSTVVSLTFPAFGYRSNITLGGSSGVGAISYYWTSTTYSPGAGNAYMFLTNKTGNNDVNHSYDYRAGMPIRCISQ